MSSKIPPKNPKQLGAPFFIAQVASRVYLQIIDFSVGHCPAPGITQTKGALK